MGTKASNIFAYIHATSNFSLKMKIGKSNRIAGISYRLLGLSEEDMRLKVGKIIFHRLKIRSKSANVAESNVEKVE